MEITIKIECNNAAFFTGRDGTDPAPGAEVSRMLRDLSEQIKTYGLRDQGLQDANGNTCGKLVIKR